MRTKQILFIHLITLLLFLVNILIAATTGYSLRSSFMLFICIAYYITMLSGFFYARSINKTLKEKTGLGIQYVLSITSIFLVEMLVATISGLYIFIVLVYKMDVPVKAKGKGYEIRLEPSLEWPPRYVLYKANFLMDKYTGDIHANEDDFNINGSIEGVALTRDTVKVTLRTTKDTIICFKK